MGRRTVRHRDIRRKRRSEKEESIKKEKLGQRGDHPTRNGPESFLYCPRLWRSSTGFLSQRGYGHWLSSLDSFVACRVKSPSFNFIHCGLSATQICRAFNRRRSLRINCSVGRLLATVCKVICIGHMFLFWLASNSQSSTSKLPERFCVKHHRVWHC